MYTIVMNDKKELITTKYATLYQKEKLADQIQFIYPQTCGLVDLSECIAVLKYIDIGNEAHSEILSKDSEPYKETKVRAVLPVDTELNRFAGNVSVRLVFMKMNPESMQLEQKMMSGNVIITIEPVDAITESTEADSALQKEDITTGSANGTIAVDGTDVEVKGLGSAAYADTTAFDAAGVAEEKVNTLANGAVADNTAAIAAINNVETGILKQAKDYVDTEVKELADGQVATNTAAITALQTTHAEDKATLQAGIDANASAIAALTPVTTDEVKALFA